MHILILTPGFPVNEPDDTCMPYLQEYLQEASNRNIGLRFSIVALQYPYTMEPYSWNGISVFPCGGKNRSFPLRLLDWIKAWKLLSKIHAEDPIEVVHSLWLTECTLLAQRWTARNNVKHVATAMGQDVLSTNRYLKYIDLENLKVAAVSQFQNEKMRVSLGRRADSVISFGMHKREVFSNPKIIDILGVGGLIPLKDYKSFLEVVSGVAKERPSLSVALVGDGAERQGLENLARKFGLSNTVEFLGHQPRKTVLELMSKSKVLLHPSTFESQGYVFNEAVASGMAIVSRKVGIAKESGRWKIGVGAEEMAEHVSNMLDASFEPETLIPLDHTVSEYQKLYA